MVIISNQLDNETIIDILTFRYARKLNYSLPKLSPSNFKLNNFEPTVLQIENLIQENIEKSIDPSKSICVALSGGIDSSIVLALLKKTFPQSKVFALSIKFSNSVDESQQAKKIAESLDVDHQTIFLDNYLSELPHAIGIVEQPFWDLHFYHVVKNSKNSDYLLSGDGSDELFGGYVFRYKKFLQTTSNDSTPLEKVKAYISCHERDWVPDQENIFSKKMNFSWEKIYSYLLPYFDNSLPPLEQVFLADYNGKLLHNWSPLFQKIAKSFDVKLITPILSQKTIDYGFSIPSNMKYDQNSDLGKLLLRKSFLQHFDQSLLQTKKQGFTVDTINLWASYGHKICKNYLIDAKIVQDGWINDSWIKKNIDNPNLDIRYINKLLGLLAFEIWYRLFITKEMKSTETLDL